MTLTKPAAVDIRYRLANECDELLVMDAFMEMLKELSELGHDVLPTEQNRDFLYMQVFGPALVTFKHGIVLALDDYKVIGLLVIIPEITRLETAKGRAIAWGAWVDPGYRKQGIALRMQEISHARLKQLGVTTVISNVMAGNTAGMASCQKAGAKITGFLTTVYL